jgi:type VI secretion system secreted protein VgrG
MKFGAPVVRIRSGVLQEDPVDGGVLDEWFVLHAKGHERLSRLYELELVVQASTRVGAPYQPDKVEALLAGHYVVSLLQEVSEDADEHGAGAVHGAMMHSFHGVIRELEMLSVDRAHNDAAGELAVSYRVTLVPRLWFTTQSTRTRLFQGLSVPEVVAHILDELGMTIDQDYAFRVTGEHMKREYLLQYQETDFDFLCRLCEHEGVFFFFEQTGALERVIFADNNEALQDYLTLKAFAESPDDARFEHVRYDPRGGVVDKVPCFKSLNRVFRARPRSVAVVDHDYKRASMDAHASADVVDSGIGTRVEYLPAKEYSTLEPAPPDDVLPQVERLARVRAQELLVGREELRAETNLLGLLPGMVFTLENHFDTDLVWVNERDDKRHRYYVTEATFRVTQAGLAGTDGVGNEDYAATLVVKNMLVAYRPPRETMRPVVAGVLSAKVADTVKGSPADIDGHGQYHLILDVPTVGAPGMGGATLKRFRMVQTFSGPGYGMHHPLHEGAEVLLVHLNGDPDRPIIVGSVPNFDQITPITARNATLGGYRTRNRVVDLVNDDA